MLPGPSALPLSPALPWAHPALTGAGPRRGSPRCHCGHSPCSHTGSAAPAPAAGPGVTSEPLQGQPVRGIPTPLGDSVTCPAVGFFPRGKVGAKPPSRLQASEWEKGPTSLHAGPCPLSLLPQCWPQWDTEAGAGHSHGKDREGTHGRWGTHLTTALFLSTPAVKGAMWPRLGRMEARRRAKRRGQGHTARKGRTGDSKPALPARAPSQHHRPPTGAAGRLGEPAPLLPAWG